MNDNPIGKGGWRDEARNFEDNNRRVVAEAYGYEVSMVPFQTVRLLVALIDEGKAPEQVMLADGSVVKYKGNPVGKGGGV